MKPNVLQRAASLSQARRARRVEKGEKVGKVGRGGKVGRRPDLTNRSRDRRTGHLRILSGLPRIFRVVSDDKRVVVVDTLFSNVKCYAFNQSWQH